MNKKYKIIANVIEHPAIVIFAICLLVCIGVYSLFTMQKDEFPAFTMRIGLVVGVYPGANAEQVESDLSKPMEDFLFKMEEVDRIETNSMSQDGLSYTYVYLNDNVKDPDVFWSKLKLKINESKSLLFPPGVIAITVFDDFIASSTMLIAIESQEKTYRELHDYTTQLSSELLNLDRTAKVTFLGEREEEIAITISQDKISALNIDPASLLLKYSSNNIKTIAGDFGMDQMLFPLDMDRTNNNEYEIAEQIVSELPTGEIVRLKDIAKIERRYKEPTSDINYSGNNAIFMNLIMRKGNNIVSYGKEVEKVLDQFRNDLPESVHVYKVTDQPTIVSKSVFSFLRDLLISMGVVILVMLILFPVKTALVASSSLPICTAAAIWLMSITGCELNTVTLAALIMVLGMVVDDSIINIDGYIDKLHKGLQPKDAAVTSASELFMPMFIATTAISMMFFPMTFIIEGELGEFVQLFPWTVLFSLGWSLVYAMMVIPLLEVKFIDKTTPTSNFARVQEKFFNGLQRAYDSLQGACFRNPKKTISIGIGTMALGFLMFSRLNVQMLPNSTRDMFAIEIELAEGSSLARTSEVCDSLQRMLLKEHGIKAVSAFIGDPAPRFHITYNPGMPSTNVAQLIVKTESASTTEDLLPYIDRKYDHYFCDAYIRVRQMDFQATAHPIEINVLGNDLPEMIGVAEQIRDYMFTLEGTELRNVKCVADKVHARVRITPKREECARLGISATAISLGLLSNNISLPITSIKEKDREVPVNLYVDTNSNGESYKELENLRVATTLTGTTVPLSQVADITPNWTRATVQRYEGKKCVSVYSDMMFGKSQIESSAKIRKFIKNNVDLPNGISIKYGGLDSMNQDTIPSIVGSFIAAVLVLLFFLLIYFKKVSIALLTLFSTTLCFFGAFFGEWAFKFEFGMTSVLGVVSLMSIIMRNGIILYEYAEELRCKGGYSAKEAAMMAGSRRMRPIFLTSATTALGVVPMIISKSSLWTPMGVVICSGVLFSFIIVLSVMPVMYWLVFNNKRENIIATDNNEK